MCRLDKKSFESVCGINRKFVGRFYDILISVNVNKNKVSSNGWHVDSLPVGSWST